MNEQQHPNPLKVTTSDDLFFRIACATQDLLIDMLNMVF